MPSMVEALRNPAAFPEKTKRVEVLQTHISTVFRGDAFVYKVKKPVNFGFLDFSDLEKREYYCRQEVKLNQRLSKDVYIGVLPILWDGENYHLRGGPGKVVDYAVKMKRVPDEKLMKSAFIRGELREHHLKRIAQVLAGFHLSALRTVEIDEFGKPESFKVNTDENFDQVERYMGKTIEDRAFEDLKAWTERFYEENGQLFRRRIAEGRIRDCHGDLHMEHICLTESLSIVDCIEFNDRFRYSDTIADTAFLLMDLEYHGGYDFSKLLWEYYKTEAMERGREAEPLLTFYKVYRAFVRGKVNSFQLDDVHIHEKAKESARRTARKYFQLAYSYIASGSGARS